MTTEKLFDRKERIDLKKIKIKLNIPVKCNFCSIIFEHYTEIEISKKIVNDEINIVELISDYKKKDNNVYICKDCSNKIEIQ